MITIDGCSCLSPVVRRRELTIACQSHSQAQGTQVITVIVMGNSDLPLTVMAAIGRRTSHGGGHTKTVAQAASLSTSMLKLVQIIVEFQAL